MPHNLFLTAARRYCSSGGGEFTFPPGHYITTMRVMLRDGPDLQESEILGTIPGSTQIRIVEVVSDEKRVRALIDEPSDAWVTLANLTTGDKMVRRLHPDDVKAADKLEEEEDEEEEVLSDDAKDELTVRNWIAGAAVTFLVGCVVLHNWTYRCGLFTRHLQSDEIASQMMDPVGKAQVGGPFTLVDTNGRPRTQAEFLGCWPLMYFGFTHCPEICPIELNRLSILCEKLKKQFPSETFVPIFVSCDPVRDTCSAVNEYIADFHEDFVALTGTPQQVAEICKSYRLYTSTPDDEQVDDGDYLVDHTISIFLFDRDFEFVDCFGGRFEVHEMVERMTRQIDNYMQNPSYKNY